MDGSAPILQLEDIVSGYGDLLVLRGISFKVFPGEIVSIIGANGAGKSTLLRTIFGLIDVRDGRIFLEGKEMVDRNPISVLRSGISYVRQGRGNLPVMTVRENLEMGAYIRNDDRVQADIESVMARFSMLREKQDEFAGNLSGGQQQILEIAMALLLSPKLIMLDEPSLGLSPIMASAAFDTVRSLKSDGVTVLLVEQNAKQALAVSDKGVVLELGVICQQGTGEELLADPDLRKRYLGG